MAAVTRFGLEGYGVRRTTFSPKPAAGTSKAPVTRFGLEGYGVRRTTFAPKPASGGGSGGHPEWIIRARRRGRR